MNIKQVKYFLTVSHEGSLSSAARVHSISVQAMSKAMADLEKELGESLFIRTHQGISLTPFGEAFSLKANEVHEAFHQLETLSDSFDEQPTKLGLFLCVPAFLNNEKARAAMATFFAGRLNVETEVAIGSGEKGMKALQSGDCDALITVGTLDDPEVDCFTIGTISPGVCMAKSHPLAKHTTVTLGDLAPYPVLAAKSFDRFNNTVFATYEKNLFSPVIWPEPAGQMPIYFYFKHAVCLMVNVAPLGEMLPFSVMVPFAEKDRKPIPICLVTLKNIKTEAYRRVEKLLQTHPGEKEPQ